MLAEQARKHIQQLADNLSETDKRMRQIYEDKTWNLMTADQKRAELDRLMVRMVEMTKRFNTWFAAIEEKE